MPKVVVNLINIDQDISFLKYMLNSNKDAMTEAGFQLSTHSIENEIKYLEDFKNTFDLAIAKKQAELVQERIDGNAEACAQVEEAGGKIFATDQFGNIFYPPPAYQYSYVELSYGNYKEFKKVRFLGELLVVFTSRFQMENVKHNISPTTLKLFENIHKIRDEYQKKGLLEEILQYINKIDEACERAKSPNKPPVLDWKYFFKNYFSPSAQWKPLGEQIPKFDYEAKFDKKKLEEYLEEIKNKKETILKALEEKKLESAANAKKENPSKGSKQDTDVQKPDVAECPTDRENILQGLDDLLNDLNKNLEKQIEDYKRRFDLNCLAKELKDCLLPPNLDFCDLLFRDISVPKFYQKLSLLKAAGLGDLYNSLVGKMEDSFGITELRQYEKEIKSLERLLREEDELRDRLNSSLEEYEEQMKSLLEDLLPIKEQMEILENNLDVERQLGRQTRINSLEKRREVLLSRMRKIQNRIELLTMQNEAIPKNLERLNVNYDEHLLRKGTLERDFAQKIAENKFNERQAQLIREGKNLEAVFLIPNEDEKYSPEAVATTIINAVDAVMPLENLCKLLFTLPFNRDFNSSLRLPEDFWTSLMTKFKDPYFNLSVDLGKLIGQLIIAFLFNILDSFLKSLCDAIGNAVANNQEAENVFTSMGNAVVNTATNAIALQANQALGGDIFNGDKLLSNEAVNLQGIDSAVSNIATTTLDVVGKQDMISWFIENGQASAFSEWSLSLDGKTFVTKNPPLFDFTQVGEFINSSVSSFIKNQNYSTQALMGMLSKEEGSIVIEEEPPLQQQALTAEESVSEMRCLLSKSMALLTPTETINLLTKKPDQNTKNIVKKLAEACAPKMSENYPGDSLVELVGEIGILAGVLEVEQQIQNLQSLNDNLPITEKVICERFDNTKAFRASLMSEAMSPELAIEILDEVEKKQQEELGFVMDSITQLADAKIIAKPQTAKQFYLSAISQIVDMQEEGKEPQSVEDLGLPEQESTDIDVKNIIKQKIEENAKNNATLNSMFELTTESLVRPIRDRFKRDSENYLDAISKNIPFEKPLVKTQKIQTPQGEKEVPTMEFINIVNMSYVPALKCKAQSTSDTIEIKSGEAKQELEKQIVEKNNEIREIEQRIEEVQNNYQNYQYITRKESPEERFYNGVYYDVSRDDHIFEIEKEMFSILRTDIAATSEEKLQAGKFWKDVMSSVLILLNSRDYEDSIWAGEYKNNLPPSLSSIDRKKESPFAEYLAVFINGWIYKNTPLDDYYSDKIPTRHHFMNHDREILFDTEKYEDVWDFIWEIKSRIIQIKEDIEGESTKQLEEDKILKEREKRDLEVQKQKFKIFVPTGKWEFEEVLVPSYVLPFSKKVDNNTILMSKIPTFGIISSTDDDDPFETKGSLIIQAKNEIIGTSEKEFYISNGFMEQNYGDPFIKQEEIEKVATITEMKRDIGRKYLDSVETLKASIDPVINDKYFGFSISSKHKSSPIDPAGGWNPMSLLGLNEENLDFDSIASNKVTMDSISCLSQGENITAIDSSTLEMLTSKLSSNGSSVEKIGQKIKENIPLWKISYIENKDAESTFSLQTTGKIFTPTGLYTNFYHDTTVSSEKTISDDTIATLVEHFGEIKSKNDSFDEIVMRQLEENDIRDIRTRNLLYTHLMLEVRDEFVKSISNPRLLEQDEKTSQKLIEFFDLTREQTELEKENELDPNIMNFVEIKENFKQLYDLEQEGEMTDSQARGEESRESKLTKAAKKTLLQTFVRICVNEYILKNIFLFDNFNFSSNLKQMNLVVTDISNFVCQESKRVKIGKELNRQAIEYYDLLQNSGKISKNDSIEQETKEWKKKNSLSSENASPKMIEIVRRELGLSLSKFKKLLKWEEGEEQSEDAVFSSFIEKMEQTQCPLLFEYGQTKYLTTPILNEEMRIGKMYIEKYVRFPEITEYGKEKIANTQNQILGQYENSVVGIGELEKILVELDLDVGEFYNCDSDKNIFSSPLTFGSRIMIVVEIRPYNGQDFINEEIIKERTYITRLITQGSNQQKNVILSPVANEEYPVSLEFLKESLNAASINEDYEKIYKDFLKPSLIKNSLFQILLKYCLCLDELKQIALLHSFMFHNDQDSRFLFEGIKMTISRIYQASTNLGNASNTVNQLNAILQEQKRNEENTGNPLGPSPEALKFYYRTPIQILKGLAMLVDPNIALADLIVRGAAMAGNLVGQKIDIPYSLASLALLPFPIFNGVAPPIPPLSSYNIAMPLGPIFLALEPLLKDLPYYQNRDKGKLGTGDGKQNPQQNPLFYELSEEENE